MVHLSVGPARASMYFLSSSAMGRYVAICLRPIGGIPVSCDGMRAIELL